MRRLLSVLMLCLLLTACDWRWLSIYPLSGSPHALRVIPPPTLEIQPSSSEEPSGDNCCDTTPTPDDDNHDDDMAYPGYPMEWDSYQYGEQLHCRQETPTSEVRCWNPASGVNPTPTAVPSAGEYPGYPMEWDSYQYGQKLRCRQETPISEVICWGVP